MSPLLLFLMACAGGGGSTDGGTDDTGTDGGTAGCLDAWSDAVADAVPGTGEMQIHGTGAWDGERLWVAWSTPDDAGLFDVQLAALDCAGQLVVDPVEATQTDDNELDPVLASDGARVLAAWTSDNGTAPSNLDIRSRVFGVDGTPTTDAADLEAERGGVVVTGNATSPAVAATASGFHLAGSWGHDDATAFQAFSVELDPDARPVGPATDLAATDNGGQLQVDVGGPGTAHAWEESDPVDFSTRILLAADGGTTDLGPGKRPSVAVTDAGTWVAWDDDAGTVHLHTPDGETLIPALDGDFRHSARLATADGGLILTWMVVESGVYGTLHAAWLSADGGVEHTEALASDVPGLYGAEPVLVDADHAFVVWTEGENPDFRIRHGRLTRP